VYGDPVGLPMHEEHPRHPTNPYGETKLALERALGWYHAAYGLQSVTLRYFNAAGATIDGALGEVHDPEEHLIPGILKAAAGGEAVPVFGTDYPTRDGTAVRDYVHVEDLAEAHVLACPDRGRPAPPRLSTWGTAPDSRSGGHRVRPAGDRPADSDPRRPRRPGPARARRLLGRARDELGCRRALEPRGHNRKRLEIPPLSPAWLCS